MTARRWELLFDGGIPANDNARRRWHWSRRSEEDKAWRTWAGVLAQQVGIPPLPRMRLSAVIYRRALGVADPRGDVMRLKPLEDGLVDAGVVPNDTYRYVELGTIREQHGAPAVRLIVEEIA